MHLLRERIRAQKGRDQVVFVSQPHAVEAANLAHSLDAWTCAYFQNSPRWYLSRAFRTSIGVYLARTVSPPRPSELLQNQVNEGLLSLEPLITEPSVQHLLLLPLFLLGFAAFQSYQRSRIHQMLGMLNQTCPSQGVTRALAVLRGLWRLIEAQDQACWDWESLMLAKGWHTIV